MESMIDAGVHFGFPRAVATKLTLTLALALTLTLTLALTSALSFSRCHSALATWLGVE